RWYLPVRDFVAGMPVRMRRRWAAGRPGCLVVRVGGDGGPGGGGGGASLLPPVGRQLAVEIEVEKLDQLAAGDVGPIRHSVQFLKKRLRLIRPFDAGRGERFRVPLLGVGRPVRLQIRRLADAQEVSLEDVTVTVGPKDYIER